MRPWLAVASVIALAALAAAWWSADSADRQAERRSGESAPETSSSLDDGAAMITITHGRGSGPLAVQPAALCVAPGDVARFRLVNDGRAEAGFTHLNGWILSRDRSTMYSAVVDGARHHTSGPLEFTTSTTIAPIALTPLPPGGAAELAVRGPQTEGDHDLQIAATSTVLVPLTVSVDCPIDS